MSLGLFLWLMLAMGMFIGGNTVLRSYVTEPRLWVLLAALSLFTIGNVMMVRLMREQGLAVAISVSSILQLVLIGLIAWFVFGERPSAMQIGGMVLGVVAVLLIAWPQGARQ
jgi:small multidrug resistance pump